jgi:RNA polymerase sigma factor (sigma-70 family)
MTTGPEPTRELIARAANGERRAVEEIVRALERPLFNVALRMLHDRQDAEDATQEALLRIVTHLGQYRGDARFSTWAWRVAIRRILDVRQQRASATRWTFDEFAADLADGRDDTAVERAEDAILYGQLKLVCSRAMLQCLDPDHRIAFILGEILELPGDEAAEILEIEAVTFRKRLSRARARLTDFLERTCGIVGEEAPCACHRRLDRALALGRVQPDAAEPTIDVSALRVQLQSIAAARRAAAFYRSDPAAESRRDFVATMRSILSNKEQV